MAARARELAERALQARAAPCPAAASRQALSPRVARALRHGMQRLARPRQQTVRPAHVFGLVAAYMPPSHHAAVARCKPRSPALRRHGELRLRACL